MPAEDARLIARTSDRSGRFPDGKMFLKRFLSLLLALGRQVTRKAPFQRLPQIFYHVEAIGATPPPGWHQ
jgi:hypothetical protein